MAVIETFLLNQLAASIEEAKSSTNFISKLFQLHEDCSQLKDLIEKKSPKTGAAFDSIRKEKLYYLNNVMAEWRMILKNNHHLTPETLRSVNNLRLSLKEIRKELQGVSHEKADSAQGGAQLNLDLDIYRWSSKSIDPKKIYGIEDKSMIMERMLVRTEHKNGLKMIGIVGMSGVGKTTLCQVSFNNQEVKKHFLPRIWVCLSKQPKDDTDYQKEVVKRILMCIGFEDEIIDKLGLEGGLVALRQQLKGKRFLIVFDDVWNLDERFQKFSSLLNHDENKQDQLAYGLPKGHGGTVIVTSRSRKLAENMVGGENLHTLLPLTDDDSCWEIFMDAVEKNGTELPEDMKKLKDMIVKKCAGLPLVAKMMGQIVHEKLQNQRENRQNQTQPQQEA
ncbi:hypothetical protein DH2020_017358 [Rehmannia glutinosa]|uniref:NB-ARC domain-containing protein n=1 Tax=Rehmannia glutinosa TaxID=99300 RepID=A0ABR0WQM6_REHGL